MNSDLICIISAEKIKSIKENYKTGNLFQVQNEFSLMSRLKSILLIMLLLPLLGMSCKMT